MITSGDAEFHESDPKVFNWAETNHFNFSVPDAGISGYAYVLTRPNIGVCHSSIYLFQGIRGHASEALFADAQMHLPCPKSLVDFTLPNGLGITVTRAPFDYYLKYTSQDQACSFDFIFKALGEPYDIHSEAQNPLRVTHTDSAEAGAWGEAWSKGHFDLIGEIKGRLVLDGKPFEINCIDGMDHSWGPRPEWEAASIGWMFMTFGNDLAFHMVCPLEIVDGQTVYQPLRFGHVCENGKVVGLVSAEVQAESHGLVGIKRHIVVTDVLGRRWEMSGEAVAGAPWHTSHPSFIVYTSLYRWTMVTSDSSAARDRVGYSHIQDVFGVGTLGRRARLTSGLS